MTSRARFRFLFFLVAVALFAIGYAVTSRGAAEGTGGVALIAALSSNERFQTFVAAPVWLTAVSVTIDRALTPQRLLRRGDRRTLACEPLRTLLIRFAIVAGAVSVVRLGIALLTMPAGSDPRVVAVISAGVLAGATALLAIGLATLYWVLLAVRLLFQSR